MRELKLVVWIGPIGSRNRAGSANNELLIGMVKTRSVIISLQRSMP